MTSVSITRNNQTFTFPDGFINKISSTVNINELDETIMPSSGPMSNIGIDVNGTTKTITIEGILSDVQNGVTSVITGTFAPTIIYKEQMKYWLESLVDGSQSAKTFTSNVESYSLSSSSGSTTIEGVLIPASFDATRVFVKSISFTEEKSEPSSIGFNMTLWVAGN